jgi:hypothetical protein
MKQLQLFLILSVLLNCGFIALFCYQTVDSVLDGLEDLEIGIPPQDCEAYSIPIEGRVINRDGEPISGADVIVRGLEHTDRFEYEVRTNADGYFSVSETPDLFRCSIFEVEVYETGYPLTTVQHYVSNFTGEYRDEIVIVLP